MLSTFIKLPFVIKIFVLSIFEWPLKTGFTVLKSCVLALLYACKSYLTTKYHLLYHLLVYFKCLCSKQCVPRFGSKLYAEISH